MRCCYLGCFCSFKLCERVETDFTAVRLIFSRCVWACGCKEAAIRKAKCVFWSVCVGIVINTEDV